MTRRVRNHDDVLFVGTHGHVSALDKRTGNELWRTSLPRTGYMIVSIVYEDETLFVGSGGHVFALDPSNGHILWKNKLPGLHHGRVLVTTKRASSVGTMVLLDDEDRTAASGSAATS